MSGIERWVHRVPFAGSDAVVACDASPRDEGAAATAAVPRAKQRPTMRKDKVDGASKDGTSMDADAAREAFEEGGVPPKFLCVGVGFEFCGEVWILLHRLFQVDV